MRPALRLAAPILGLSLLIAGSAKAQSFPPPPSSGTVYDGAHLLDASSVDRLNGLSRQFQQDTGAPIVVVTLPALASVGAQSMGIDAYARALFDRWRIGNAKANGGILLLVAKADRRDKIELGKDWARDYDARAHSINQETILPAFKGGDYQGGIVRGCEALADLASNTAPTSEIAPPMNGLENGGFSSALDGFGGLLCPVAVIGIIVIVVAASKARSGRRYRRFDEPDRTYYVDPSLAPPPIVDDDAAFLAGMAAGEIMSQPTYDPGPVYDPGPDPNLGGFDSGGSSDSGSFDSGSSGGGGDSGSW